jgi:hypothetical protein
MALLVQVLFQQREAEHGVLAVPQVAGLLRPEGAPARLVIAMFDVVPIIESIAMRAVVHLDTYTLGPHPDADKREAGELAVIDWSQPGGVVLDASEAAVTLVRLTSPARALGAALLAATKHDREIADELPLISGLAMSAEHVAETTDGGPADPALRIALCARMLALHQLGDHGDAIPSYDTYGRDRSPAHDYGRPEARLPIDGGDFWRLDLVAHVPLTAAERSP